MFTGESLRIAPIANGLVELCFDRRGETINKLDERTLRELGEAVAALKDAVGVDGVLITSAKPAFIVGGDITEFGKLFDLPEAAIAASNERSNAATNGLEDLPVPTVAALNGLALGGGLEVALCADFRVMSSDTQVGLPEVKLGLFPGLGGTVRLPRVAGPQAAIDWISSGTPASAEVAAAVGVIDEIASPERVRDAAIALLTRAAAGEIDWRARRRTKTAPVSLERGALSTLFEAAKSKLALTASKHQPAALAAVELMQRSAGESRDAALRLESEGFARIAKTQAADSLVQAFLNDQLLRKKWKLQTSSVSAVGRAAVIGAGIMGGGIAYVSAARGTPVVMKDINHRQLEAGITEARKLLARQVKTGRFTQEKADRVLGLITPQLDFAGFEQIDLVVEAVTESLTLKHAVIAETERAVRPGTVIATNTSSLRVDDLAAPLQRPENFVGMHFFNPVPVMRLVEIIRGARSAESAVSTAVSYAVAMGKTPIVVRDSPGFLVNRVMTPYTLAFMQLIRDGADFAAVDLAMEAFGWPMGPAYLSDVVGIDTNSHVLSLICAGFPDRLKREPVDAIERMAALQRFGQKSGAGFYRYPADATGRPRKTLDPESRDLLAAVQPHGPREFAAADIVERMMLPLIIEAARCLDDQTVDSAPELDVALLLGVGFPPHVGGALKYADWLGLPRVVEMCDRHAHLGGHYQVADSLRAKAAKGERYYPR